MTRVFECPKCGYKVRAIATSCAHRCIPNQAQPVQLREVQRVS